MGGELSQPVELIRVQRHGSAAFRVAAADMQGWRLAMEDANAIRCVETSASCWVLDGHAGSSTANFAAAALVEEFASHLNAGCLPADEQITESFFKVDCQWRRQAIQQNEFKVGSTVTGALAIQQSNGLYIVKILNCGDSRSVAIRSPYDESGLSPILIVTDDHKPNHPEELRRIQEGGGFVSGNRVDGKLSVSRALGNFEFKCDCMRAPEKQKVICVPDVFELRDVAAGSIIVCASDGFWNVRTPEEVVEFVHGRLLDDSEMDLGDAAAELVRTSIQRKSRDNVTVMIMHFVDGLGWTHAPDEMQGFEKLQRDDALHFLPLVKHHEFALRKGFKAEACKHIDGQRWLLNGLSNASPNQPSNPSGDSPTSFCGLCGMRTGFRKLLLGAWQSVFGRSVRADRQPIRECQDAI